MPFWYFGSLILTAGLAIATWGESAAGAAIAAAGLLAVSIVMSIALLVPINNRSAMWTANDHPTTGASSSQRWDRLHYARVASSLRVCADGCRRDGRLTLVVSWATVERIHVGARAAARAPAGLAGLPSAFKGRVRGAGADVPRATR